MVEPEAVADPFGSFDLGHIICEPATGVMETEISDEAVATRGSFAWAQDGLVLLGRGADRFGFFFCSTETTPSP